MRFFNYPYEAIEEAMANAVYHRSYEHPNRIEVNVRLDCIEIVSYPGPLPPLDAKVLKQKRVVARNYRNRRIGDFLKELDLTEGRSTGFPKIYKAIEKNGSPRPEFTTDIDRNYFLAVFKKHPLYKVEAQVEIGATEEKILDLCTENPKSKMELANLFGHANVPGNIKRAVQRLQKEKLLVFTIPEKPKSSKQKYKTTQRGLAVISDKG